VKIEAYETSEGRVPYLDWFDRLDGTLRRAAQRRLRAIEDSDHFGNRKNLRGGLHELKFRQVIRIYFAEIDGQIVLLLGGSGKQNQDREITKARARLKDFKQRTR
jgi:putative addiction module killer protein